MNGGNELLRNALAKLRAHGLKAEVKQGRHIKLRFRNTHGVPCMLILSRSPSSAYACDLSRADLRRLLKRKSD